MGVCSTIPVWYNSSSEGLDGGVHLQYNSISQGLDGGVSTNRRENNKQQGPTANWRSTQGKQTICKWKETNKLEG